jgi:hypothetical protein
MATRILWSMVRDWCPVHLRRDCPEAERMRQERERIMEAMESMSDLTPPVVVIALGRSGKAEGMATLRDPRE